MAILKVAQMGHPILRSVADRVDPSQIQTPEFQQLCDDMFDTMLEYDGAGLAAPQVHAPLRVVLCALTDDREPEFFVNPIITRLTEETIRTFEGCLSVDGMRAAVDRCAHVHIQAMDREGNPKGYELTGFPAVVVQHECDHLDGILYIDRCDTRTLSFVREYRRYGGMFEAEEEDADGLGDPIHLEDDTEEERVTVEIDLAHTDDIDDRARVPSSDK